MSHIVENYFMEGRALVGEAFFSVAEFPEFLGGSWSKIVVELKGESSLVDSVYFQVEKAKRSVSHVLVALTEMRNYSIIDRYCDG